ncbi:hypothetical protein ACFHW2_22140 [Actinomadura sp. LOL_016]|uniref:hypothetical protein n=1 Tax=unclassified Actinomadura TaxID=2626254 RepID=UPI003A80659F
MKAHSSGHPTPPPHYTTEVSKDAGVRAMSGPAAAQGASGPPKGRSPALAVAAVLLFPLGVPAVVCGHLARRRWRKGEVTIDMVDARFIAAWGMVMGYMMTAFYLMMGALAASTFLT